MTKILLIRHGNVEGIKPERFRGRAPLDLTELGRAQAQAVARRVAGAWRPSKIYTSPMGRCIETGAAIAKACGAPTEVCDDLTDIDYGAWQFKTFDEAKAKIRRCSPPGSRRRISSASQTANRCRTSWPEPPTLCG